MNLKIKNKKLAVISVIVVIVSTVFIYPLVENPVKFGDFTEQSYLTKFKRAYGSLTGNWFMKNEGYEDIWSNVIWGNKDAIHVKPGQIFDIGAKVKNHGTEGTGDNKGGVSLFQITTNFYDSYGNTFYGGRENAWYSDNVLLYPANEYKTTDHKPIYFVYEGDKEQSVDPPYDYYAFRKPKICSIVFEEGRKYAEEKIENGVYVWYLPALHKNKKEGNYVDLTMQLAKAKLIKGNLNLVENIKKEGILTGFTKTLINVWYMGQCYTFHEGEIIQTFHTRVYCDYIPPSTTPSPTKDTDKDGIPDSEDPDIDGDGIPNNKDPTPYGEKGGLSGDMETELILGLVIGVSVIAGIIVLILRRR